MDYHEFLDRIIDEGIAAAEADYEKGPKLDGSVAGFEACRGKPPESLKSLLGQASADTHNAIIANVAEEDYWRIRCYGAEVEWVCNCVSVLLMSTDIPVIVPPTARAAMKVASIVGVEEGI